MFSAKPFSRRRRTSTRAPSAVSRPLTLERLEERDVPAGIVNVVGIGDDDAGTISLELYGSPFNDQVDIVRENNQVKVIAQGSTVLRYFKSSTSVLEQATVTYTQITFNVASIRDITIKMGVGHDAVRVINFMEEPANYDYGALSVDLGSGNDSFLFSGYVHDRVASFSLDSGAGDDSVLLDRIDVRAGETLPIPTLYTGDGNDAVYLNESIVGIFIWLGGGNNTLWMNGCDIGRGDFYAYFGNGNDTLTVNSVISYVGGGYSFTVDLGHGNNQVTFSGSNSIGYFDGNVWQGGVTVLGGAGNDQLTFTGSTYVGNKLQILLGEGSDLLFVASTYDDVFTLSVDGPDGEINTRILMGPDNDRVRFGDFFPQPPNFLTVMFADYTLLDMGDGLDSVDIEGAIFHSLTMSLRNGNDSVQLRKCEGVDINVSLGDGDDGLRVTSCISDSLTVNMGSGNDVVGFSGNNAFGRFDDPNWVGGLTVWGLPGNDGVRFETEPYYEEVNQTRVLNKLAIDLGGGDDRFYVSDVDWPSDPPILSVDGPDGQFNTDISMGRGNDYVSFGVSRFRNVKNLDFADKTRLDLGPGDDELVVENSTFNLLIALLGDGNDRVLNNWGGSGVTVGAGSKLDGGAGTNLLPAGWATPPNLTILRFARGIRRL
jgi:hypothetical protein